ncbi:MAG: signal peptidase I [Candidatus Protistobacter heckmanni]|nr:signal peptidase I [Candidatus Protistobacter heckmanni]
MNFALILFILTVVTGIAWAADKLAFAPRRRARAQTALAEFDARRPALQASYGDAELGASRVRLAEDLLRQPLWLEYSASFFPVILAMFLLRSFLVEPFKIPSGSMVPTLLVGDFILVNKYAYGVRLPVINKKVVQMGEPKRGDVAVFRYPKDPSQDYIKRVIGLPGDTVEYINKRLTVNGQPVAYEKLPDYLDEERLSYSTQWRETVGGVKHEILNDADRPSQIAAFDDFPFRSNCVYDPRGVTCKVSAGHYFMMGDNRDNSADSRYWGFVPEENLVGRAFFVWMNLGNIKRIGRFQ